MEKGLMGGLSSEDLVEYWALASKTDWGQHMASKKTQWGHTIPIKLHGDDASSYKEKSATFVSLIGMSHEEDSRLLVIVVPTSRHYHEGSKNITLQAIGGHLYEDLCDLKVGNWHIVFAGCTGDLKFHMELFPDVKLV